MTQNTNVSANETIIPESIIRHPAWFRLNDQMNWYDRKSRSYQCYYKFLTITLVTLAALIPVTALLPGVYAKWIAAVFGALIAVVEAIRYVNRYASLWYCYRATAESLKREKYLFLSGAGRYKNLCESDLLVTLAQSVEDILSAEHTYWLIESRCAIIGQK